MNILNEIGMNGILDITLMTIIIYTILVWFKRTQAAFVLTGIFILAGVYLLARFFNLVMTASVFERFFAVILITLIVIFQEEIRHFFEQVAVWSLNQRFNKQKVVTLSRPEVDGLVRTVMDFAREKIGALIILKGRDMIIRHLDGGEDLNGRVSEPLLKSIFDPHSIGHDGAVIVERDHITKFACHLPLSKNLQKLKGHGTRHAAALGLSELSDVICLVVSEERGTISIARAGDLWPITDPEKLTTLINEFYLEIHPQAVSKPWQDIFKKSTREKIYATLMSIGLWFVLVYGSKPIYQSYTIPVGYTNLPLSWIVEKMEPKEVVITLKGQRRDFFLMNKNSIKINLDFKLQEREQYIKIHPEEIVFPKKLELKYVEPADLKIKVKKEKDNSVTIYKDK